MVLTKALSPKKFKQQQQLKMATFGSTGHDHHDRQTSHRHDHQHEHHHDQVIFAEMSVVWDPGQDWIQIFDRLLKHPQVENAALDEKAITCGCGLQQLYSAKKVEC